MQPASHWSLPVAPGTTSHPGYRPTPKNATIHANLGFVGLPLQQHIARQKETIVRQRFSGSMTTVAIAAVAAVISGATTRTSAQAPAPSATAPVSASALKTPWGEPDLQGIWTDENDTPLQRPVKYANQEFFTAAQRAELDEARAAVLGQDRRAARGSENDVASGYNSSFWSWKRIGARTSLIADPANGRIPPLMPEAQKMAVAEREFRLAL